MSSVICTLGDLSFAKQMGIDDIDFLEDTDFLDDNHPIWQSEYYNHVTREVKENDESNFKERALRHLEPYEGAKKFLEKIKAEDITSYITCCSSIHHRGFISFSKFERDIGGTTWRAQQGASVEPQFWLREQFKTLCVIKDESDQRIYEDDVITHASFNTIKNMMLKDVNTMGRNIKHRKATGHGNKERSADLSNIDNILRRPLYGKEPTYIQVGEVKGKGKGKATTTPDNAIKEWKAKDSANKGKGKGKLEQIPGYYSMYQTTKNMRRTKELEIWNSTYEAGLTIEGAHVRSSAMTSKEKIGLQKTYSLFTEQNIDDVNLRRIGNAVETGEGLNFTSISKTKTKMNTVDTKLSVIMQSMYNIQYPEGEKGGLGVLRVRKKRINKVLHWEVMLDSDTFFVSADKGVLNIENSTDGALLALNALFASLVQARKERFLKLFEGKDHYQIWLDDTINLLNWMDDISKMEVHDYQTYANNQRSGGAMKGGGKGERETIDEMRTRMQGVADMRNNARKTMNNIRNAIF